MPNYSAWLEANPDIRASLTASDGHIYYMPTINVPYNYQPVVMYNMKWLADAGLEVPTTLDELTEVLRYFKSHDMNGNGEADEIPLSIMDDFLPYMFAPAFGLTFLDGQVEQGSGFMVNDEGEVVYAQATDEYRQYLEYLHGLYEEGLLEVEYTTLTRDQIIERFAQDRTGVTCDWSYQSSMTYSPQLPYYDGTEATGVVLQPPLSGPHEGYYIGRNPMGMVYGISSDSDKIQLAARYLDYAWGDANQEMYVWGIEGVSYVVNEDGSKSFTEKAQTDSNWLQALGINPAQVIPARQSVPATDVLVAEWHADMDKVIETIPPGSDHLLCTPWMLGERCPVSSTTTRATLFNIGPEHTREHLMRAVYEGIGYNLRWILENFEKDYGFHCRQFRIIGGGALDDAWMQIIADITRAEFAVVDNPRNAGALGAAIIALIGLGELESFESAKQFVKENKTYRPNPANGYIYDEMFATYKRLYKSLKRTYYKANALRFGGGEDD